MKNRKEEYLSRIEDAVMTLPTGTLSDPWAGDTLGQEQNSGRQNLRGYADAYRWHLLEDKELPSCDNYNLSWSQKVYVQSVIERALISIAIDVINEECADDQENSPQESE